MILFRQFRFSDADNVFRVAMESWKFTYRDIYSRDFIADFVGKNYTPEVLGKLATQAESGKIFFDVAESEKGILGFCQIGKGKSGWELNRIYILPGFTRNGIGGKLLQLGEDFIRSKRADKYFCFVHKKNETGIHFYLGNGFVHIATLDKGDELYFEKLT